MNGRAAEVRGGGMAGPALQSGQRQPQARMAGLHDPPYGLKLRRAVCLQAAMPADGVKQGNWSSRCTRKN